MLVKQKWCTSAKNLHRLRLAMHSFNQMVQHQNLKTVPPFLVYKQIVANTISQNNSMINRVKNMPPHLTMKILYYSFIQPHLQYGSTVWGGCSNQKKKRVVAIQKRSVRTICKVYFTSHTEPKMKKVDILKLDDLYKQQCLVNVHSCVHETAPWPIT